MPWRCLPQAERTRLSKVTPNARSSEIISIPTFYEARAFFKDKQTDQALPFVITTGENFKKTTTLLLGIDWTFSKKRIPTAFKRFIDEYGPPRLEEYRVTMIEVNSSAIRSIGYDGYTLSVEFHSGRIYDHPGVPRSVYAGLMSASSIGRYYS
jgi:hypothetical protein